MTSTSLRWNQTSVTYMIIHDDVADDSNGNSSKVHIAQCQQSMSKLKNVAICNMADDGSKKVYAQKNFKNTNFISTDSCYSNTSQRIEILREVPNSMVFDLLQLSSACCNQQLRASGETRLP